MVVKREIFVVERVFVSFYHKNIFIKFLTTPDMRNLKKKKFGGRTIFYGVLTGNYCGRTVDPMKKGPSKHIADFNLCSCSHILVVYNAPGS